jgi:hypothetical protein
MKSVDLVESSEEEHGNKSEETQDEDDDISFEEAETKATDTKNLVKTTNEKEWFYCDAVKVISVPSSPYSSSPLSLTESSLSSNKLISRLLLENIFLNMVGTSKRFMIKYLPAHSMSAQC